MFIINRCFKNIWLESQMIHVALFSFQRTTLSFEALASSDSFIVPHLFQTVKNFFIFLFLSESSAPARRFQSRSISCQADVSRRLVLYYRMMVHLSTPFPQKLQSFLSSCSKTKTHRLLDASYWLLVAAQRFELRTLRVWTACSSQLSYAAKKWWAGMDSNHRNPKMTDLQSVPFNHSGTYPCLNKCVKNKYYYSDSPRTCQHLFIFF